MPFTFTNSPFNPKWSPTGSGSQLPFLSPAQISVNQDNENIIVSFGNVLDAQSYRLYINGAFVLTSATNSFNYTFTNNGSYNVEVRAFANGYKYSKSNIIVITVDSLGNFLFTGLRRLTSGLRQIIVGK